MFKCCWLNHLGSINWSKEKHVLLGLQLQERKISNSVSKIKIMIQYTSFQSHVFLTNEFYQHETKLSVYLLSIYVARGKVWAKEEFGIRKIDIWTWTLPGAILEICINWHAGTWPLEREGYKCEAPETSGMPGFILSAAGSFKGQSGPDKLSFRSSSAYLRN